MPPTKLSDVAGYLAALRNPGAAKDWCFNECLANDHHYAKPDSEKEFILWEAEGTSISISSIVNIQVDHPWIWSTFIIDALSAKKKVRFPFNNYDCRDAGVNLSWETATYLEDDNRIKFLQPGAGGHLFKIPRWSTASRSCLSFIPENIDPFEVQPGDCLFSQERKKDNSDNNPFSASEVAQQEWANRTNRRFYTTVGKALGSFCSSSGGNLTWPHPINQQKGRLYSVKTGVSHVGSKNQIFAGKHKLESNSAMAMLRSQVIRAIEANRKVKHRDHTCLTQVEILTVTAKCKPDGVETVDGFQVRDITGMRSDQSYLPAHAIPYSDNAFYKSSGSGGGFDVEDDVEYWRNHFSIPCGRAKARMLLEFGLIHSSANAQNFLIAFTKYGELGGFVLRDIGDTYWHQYFLKNIWGTSHPSYNAYLHEASQDINHTLHTTSSGDYPAPHMARLASYSVITHDFAENMIKNRNWNYQAVLEFTQGLFDGFREYCVEAFAKVENPFTPRAASWRTISDPEILRLGKKMAYPTKPFYTRQDAHNICERAPASAAHIRSRGKAILDTQAEKLKAIQAILNAEEVLLCAELEGYVMNFTEGKLGKVIELPKVCPPED